MAQVKTSSLKDRRSLETSLRKSGPASPWYESMPGTEGGAAGVPLQPGDPHRIRISRKDLIYFIGQLAIMFDTGLNLMAALECLAKQAKNPQMERLVKNIRDSISQGNPLWVAMSHHSRVFSPICVSMVRAGEISGTMGEMLTKLELYLERQDDIRSRVRSAMSYPVFMMILATGVVVFLLAYVFPKFEGLFEGKEEHLPVPTRIFLAVGVFFKDYWYYVVPAAVALLVGVIYACSREEVKKHIDPLLLKIPLLGDLLARMSISRSFHTLALMLDGGIPTLDALRMAKDVSGNTVYRDAWTKVAVEVENGRDFVGPLRSTPKIAPSQIQILSMGDQAGTLSQVLTKLSQRGDREVDVAVKSLISFIEPALIMVLGLVVGMIVLSLILPIFAMSKGNI